MKMDLWFLQKSTCLKEVPAVKAVASIALMATRKAVAPLQPNQIKKSTEFRFTIKQCQV
jgi:hypothetical protein